jgi:hypothetical protein
MELPIDLLRPRNVSLLKRLVFGGNDGFWLASSATPRRMQPSVNDSVTSVLRRLTR